MAAPFTDEAADDMLTIEPPPLASMAGRKAWIVQNMLRTLRLKPNCHWSSVASSALPWWTKPAQLKSTSAAPTSLAKAPIAVLSSTSSLRVLTPSTPAKPFSFSASRSVAHTTAPSRANARAVAAPIPCPAAVTTQTLPFRRMLSPLLWLDQTLFLVEFFRAVMQRNADTRERRLQPDHLSLDVPRVEELARIGIPQCRRHLIDERWRLLGRREPERVDADRPDAAHAPVGLVGNFVGREEIVLLHEECRLRTVDRDQIDARGTREIDDRTLRP